MVFCRVLVLRSCFLTADQLNPNHAHGVKFVDSFGSFGAFS